MAQVGHEVRVFDIDAAKLAMLARGIPPFYEPGFQELLQSTLASGRLLFTESPKEAIEGAQLHFVCVGTPQQQGADAADLSYVEAAFQAVVEHADRPGLVVGKSTVPVGTAERLSNSLSRPDKVCELEVAWNPEFLREGSAIADTLKPDRLVFGVTSESAEGLLVEVYNEILEGGIPYITTDLATSEMVKVAANSFLATKISFINAMAEICEVAGADVVTLSRALGYDERIGARFLHAGLGFGGGCLPKDIRAFSARAGELGAADAVSFLREIDKINLRRRERLVSLVGSAFSGDFLGRHIAVLGAAFKPNSDDVRDSPALNVAAAMHLKGASVRVHDPQAISNAKKMFPTLTYCESIEDACRDADLVVLATEWSDYRVIDPKEFSEIVRRPVLVDGRNALDHSLWTQAGWKVYALGRGKLNR
ncbi:putative UDP-glucose 6-dehydrogenase (UdgA) [Mycolicibacterium duvalii]|uniref:UDP-glucose 6-dehydrogenase n=2 Tax=Mycolicibacterium duvalii TaxID=39688 RepID=A0A7I7K333_9MYCO|nr:UDP-glucose/GDP-mannose dehydrogenase family protein [Mycolicibacterium duvalii]BBX18004.1 putative UDP-glucose 6-dehydrogenase (UdgA) [Mycolicibacterium duvalii]